MDYIQHESFLSSQALRQKRRTGSRKKNLLNYFYQLISKEVLL